MKKCLIIIVSILWILSLSSCDTNFSLPTNNEIEFSLDNGKSWQITGGELEEFEIWNEDTSGKDESMLFFYATTYDELLLAIDIAKKGNSNMYYYPSNDDLDQLKDMYDEEYFKNYVMLYYFKYECNVSKNYAYNAIVNGNELTLNINRFDGMSTALSSWLQMVSIKKNDIADVNSFNVTIRTISPLVDSIFLSIADLSVRDVYINGLSKSDFKNLDNLKDISLFRWSLNVDIHFNAIITDKRLTEILDIFENSSNVFSIGYTSTTWIRVQANTKFLDSVLANTLKITDLIPASALDSSAFSINCLSFTPFAFVTLYLTKPGRIHAEKMVNQLKQLDFPFINQASLDEIAY